MHKNRETVAVTGNLVFTVMKKFLLPILLLGHEHGKRKKAKTQKTFKSVPLAFALFNTIACLSGCSNRPSKAQLDTWREEARSQNAAIAALRDTDSSQRDWQFAIQGETTTGKRVQLSLSQLKALATTSVWTKEPHNTKNPNAILHFRGVAVSTLLDKVNVAPDVNEVTFVARDGYRATVSLADLRQYPIIIALSRNNQKISRSDGGPLYLVFPHTEFPQLQEKYPDRFWAFYLTNMILGTEPIRLQVGKRTFDATALEKLPQVTIEATVGYRIGWPVGKVKLHGVRLGDVLTAAQLTLSPNSAVIVRGKSPVYRDPTHPILLKASDLKKCDIVLATHWGDDRTPIPARMGGPVTLAFSSECQTQSDTRHWVTFVEKLQVKQ